MYYATFQNLVYGSNQGQWLYDEDKGIYTLRNNLNVTIRIVRDELDRSFTEPWHQGLSDPAATRSMYELYFGASYVASEFVVTVDGGRASIPLPEDDHGSLWITGRQHAFGRIIDRLRSLDEYLKRCNIQVRQVTCEHET